MNTVVDFLSHHTRDNSLGNHNQQSKVINNNSINLDILLDQSHLWKPCVMNIQLYAFVHLISNFE